MGAPRYTLSDTIAAAQSAVLNRTSAIDVVSPGGDADVIITPLAVLANEISNAMADASDIVSQVDPSNLSEGDALGVIGNEIRRRGATPTVATLTCYTEVRSVNSPPGSDITIYRGTAIGSVPDPATGASVTCYVAQTATLPAASAASYYSSVRGRFELSFLVVFATEVPARLRGAAYAGAMSRPLQALPSGFVGVTNLGTIVPASGAETVAQSIERYRLALRGTSTSSPEGIEMLLRGQGVTDYLVVNQTSPLVTRPETSQGAPIDIFIREITSTSVTETLAYTGPGVLYVLGTQPVISIDSITFNATTLTPVTHYTTTLDAGSLSGSVRARDGVIFTAAGETVIATAIGGATGTGANLTVTYSVAQSVRTLTSALTQATGVDPLPRRGRERPIYLSYSLRPRVTVAGGFPTVNSIVQSALIAYVNRLKMEDGSLDIFDLQAEIGKLPSVDNFVITRLTTSATGVGATDITYTPPEFLTLSAANITASPL